MKPAHRILLLFILGIPFAFFASAQGGAQSLGDIAKQERERRMAKTDATETAGMKEADFHANILITDSKAAVEKWVLMPAAEKANAGRFRQIPPNKKFFVPFVVTDYAYPVTEKMDLTAHIRVISPSGKILLEQPTFSETIGADKRSPHTIVVNPVMDITFAPTDLQGIYTFRLTVVDHVHSTYSKAEEKVELVQAKKETGETAKSPAIVPASETH